MLIKDVKIKMSTLDHRFLGVFNHDISANVITLEITTIKRRHNYSKDSFTVSCLIITSMKIEKIY